MRLLVTGSNGQLGRALKRELDGDRHAIRWTDLADLDVGDLSALRAAAEASRPETILHLAAWTQVDECERDPERAFAVNTRGTRHVAQVAREFHARVIFVSSDYVFDGRLPRAYLEYDTPAPLNAYGWSKLHGERAVQALVDEHVIVRTSGLFGEGGPSFVTAILNAHHRQGRVSVVNDQVCRPTYAGDLAAALAQLLQAPACGIYHVASAGAVGWYEFARTVLQEAGRNPDDVNPISSRDLGRPAERPALSVLDTRLYETTFGCALPHWRDGLARCVAFSLSAK